MGERGGYVVDLAVLLADALYEQGRFDEAQQLIDEVNAEPSSATVFSTRLTEAKLLARRGQFAVARQLVGQAEALLSPTSAPMTQADVLQDQGRGRAARRRTRPGRGQPARRPADLRGPAGNDSGRADQGRPCQPRRPAWPRASVTGPPAGSTRFQPAFNTLR